MMSDELGHRLWEAELDIYGIVLNYILDSLFSLSDCTFRYQEQYAETRLYYNRFRYPLITVKAIEHEYLDMENNDDKNISTLGIVKKKKATVTG